MDEKHQISQKLDQTGDKLVAKYDEKTGRNYYDDKAAAESASEKASGLGASLGEIAGAASEGYSKTRASNTTALVDAPEEEAPPGYDEICPENYHDSKLPAWCDQNVFQEAFTTTICTQEELFKICVNMVARFALTT